MPIYEYQCDECKKVFEEFQSFNDSPPENCKFCGSSSIKKLVSNTSFILKGNGWYVTDYARKSSKEKKTESISDKTSAKSTSQKSQSSHAQA